MSFSKEMAQTPSSSQQSNLQRFLDCTTPVLPSHQLSKMSVGDGRSLLWHSCDTDTAEYFTLEELWDCYGECSAYGAGVPVMLNTGETLFQYYVPYLSALQVYTSRDPKDENGLRDLGNDSGSDDSESDRFSRSLSNSSSRGWDSTSCDSSFEQEWSWPMMEGLGSLYCQYFERCAPYWRIPLMDKITELARSYPSLKTLQSNDLCPASWMAVAWYPIYHIPARRNVKDLSTCFITYHTLSSSLLDNASCLTEHNGGNKVKRKGFCSSEVRVKNEAKTDEISLSPFGLATYKMQGNVWMNMEGDDTEKFSSLLSSAGSWLKQLGAQHHDFNYFCSHFL